MLFDIHVHSTLSACSILDIATIVEHAGFLGLDGICITDHDTMAARHEVKEGLQHNGVCLIIGMEYSTHEGDFLLFGPFENLNARLSAEELLETVSAQGGVAVAAHPFRKERPAAKDIFSKGLCKAIETRNGRNSLSENEEAEMFSSLLMLTSCGGSDAHTSAELGRMVTRFTSPVRSKDDLITCIAKGLCCPEIGSALSECPQSRTVATQ